MNDSIFESPYPSETTMEVPEYDDFIHEFPPNFDDEQDVIATQAFLDSLGNPEDGWIFRWAAIGENWQPA